MAKKYNEVEEATGMSDEFDGDEPLVGEGLEDDEVEAAYLMGWCRSCKANRSHTVVDEVDDDDDDDDDDGQVALCTECGDEHPLEAPRNKTRRSTKASKHSTALVDEADLQSPEKIIATWTKLTSGVAEGNVLNYTPKQAYKVADVMKHPSFGIGVVFAMPSPTKVEVLFEDKPRRLVCNR